MGFLRLFLNFSILPILLIMFLLCSCSDDSTTGPEEISDDYFPVSKNYVWTYTTNAMSDDEGAYTEFMIKIDSVSFGDNGKYLAVIGSLDGINWGPLFAIKDSGGVIYSLGDHPVEGEFPLFKHRYNNDEVVKEEITIRGTKYETVKFVFHTEDGTVSFWFAKGIGLIKEYSERGVSLFIDNHSGNERIIITELVAYQK